MSEDVKVKIGGDSQEAEAAMDRVGEAFEHLGHAAHAMEGAFGFEKIKDAFMEMVDASSAAESAQRKYTGALSSSSEAAKPAEMFEFAESLQQVSTFSARTTTEAASMMARFRMTQDQIEGMMPAVQDLASFMGRDLVGASDDVGRAVATGGRALQGLGLGFTAAERKAFDLMSTQQRMDAIQNRISSTMGGFSQVVAQTATGSLAQLKNSIESMNEAFGSALSKPIAGFFQTMNGIVRSTTQAFNALSPELQNTLGYMGTGVAGVGMVAAGLASLSGVVGMVSGALPAVVKGFEALKVAGMQAVTGIVLPMAAIALAVVAVIEIVGAFKRAWDVNLGGMRDTILGWADSFMQVWDKLCDYASKTWDKVATYMTEKLTLITAAIKGLDADAAGAQVRAAQQGGGGAGLATALKGAWGAGKEMLGTAATEFKANWAAGTDVMKKGMQALGLDKIFGAQGEKLKNDITVGGKQAAAEIVKDLNTGLKDLFGNNAGKSDAANKAQDQASGSALINSTGGVQAAHQFLTNLELMSGLSEATLTRIIQATGSINIGGITKVATALKDVSDKTANSLLDITGGNVASASTLAQSMKGLTDTAQQNILAAANGNTATMQQMIADMQATSAVTDTATQAIQNYWTSAAGKAQAATAGASGGDATQKVVSGAVGQMGAGGQMINAAMQGAATAGPMGAIAAVGMQLLTQSKSFQAIIGGVSTMLGNLAQAFNPLFDMLGPILQMVGQVVAAIGTVLRNIFTGLAPVFGLITAVLKPILSIVTQIFGSLGNVFKQIFSVVGPIISAIMPIVSMIGALLSSLAPVLLEMGSAMSPIGPIIGIISALFKALGPVFKVMDQVMQEVIDIIIDVFKALGTAWNAIISGIQHIIKLFDFIPGMKDKVDKFADSLDSAKVNMDQFGTATTAVAAAADTTATTSFPSLDTSADGVTDANNAQADSTDDLTNSPDGFRVTLDKFTSIMATGADNAQAFLQNSNAMANLGNSNPNYTGQVSGTDTTGAASTAVGAANNGAQLGVVPPVVNINVSTADPTTVANKALTILTQNNVTQTGNPLGSSNPYAVPTTMSGRP